MKNDIKNTFEIFITISFAYIHSILLTYRVGAGSGGQTFQSERNFSNNLFAAIFPNTECQPIFKL